MSVNHVHLGQGMPGPVRHAPIHNNFPEDLPLGGYHDPLGRNLSQQNSEYIQSILWADPIDAPRNEYSIEDYSPLPGWDDHKESKFKKFLRKLGIHL